MPFEGGRRVFLAVAGSRTAKFVLAGFVAIVSAVLLALTFENGENVHGWSIPFQNHRQRSGRLHLLVPATSSNSDLCKLLVSAQILGYPTPVLINYGEHEDLDPYVQHLGKVRGIFNYLERLDKSDEYDEDLVLIIDGYDIWFQLRPEVLIKRFYDTNQAADKRAVETYGQALVDRYDLHQRVIFSVDKLCWPVDFSRPACWAVRESPLPHTTFGPQSPGSDPRDHNDARWLNSGAILGSARDLKRIFDSALVEISTNYVTNSDQFYFATLFGAQEFARAQRKPELLEKLERKVYSDWEDAVEGQVIRKDPNPVSNETEYHIGLDYPSSMFQALAFWKPHLTWTRTVDSWSRPEDGALALNSRDLRLPRDIQQSLPPFAILKKYDTDPDTHPPWSGVELLYNVVTKEFPVLLHLAGSPEEKRFRLLWWQKLWFQGQAERLRLASRRPDQRNISSGPIAGTRWMTAEGDETDEIEAGGKGGAWSDRGVWLSWNQLCKNFEEEIFHVPGDGFWHPSSGSHDQQTTGKR